MSGETHLNRRSSGVETDYLSLQPQLPLRRISSTILWIRLGVTRPVLLMGESAEAPLNRRAVAEVRKLASFAQKQLVRDVHRSEATIPRGGFRKATAAASVYSHRSTQQRTPPAARWRRVT